MTSAAVLLLLAFAASGANGFRIAILQSNPVAISTGLDLLLTCYPVDVSMYVPLEWWGPDTTLITTTDQSQRRYLQSDPNDPRKVQLIVRSVQSIDAGQYICKYNPGIDAGGQIVAVSITVQVTQLLTVVSCSNFQFMVYREAMRMIVCQVTGNPAPTRIWYFSPALADGSASGTWTAVQSGAKYSYQNNGLQVYNVAYSDSGWYRLQASIESAGQSVTQDINVYVDTYPNVTGPAKFLEPYNIPATGYDLWMQCLGISGDPLPSMHWYWNNQYDQELTQILSSRYYSDVTTGILQIKQLGVNDAGMYTCRAANRDGYTDYNFQLTVIMRPQVVQYFNITAELNSNAQLICTVSGSAPLTLWIWKTGDPWNVGLPNPYSIGTQPDDTRISYSVSSSVSTTMNYNQYIAKLNIAGVKPNDTGNYSCIAQNAGGNMTQNGTLIAVYKPVMDTSVSALGVGYAGNSTNLTCIAWGNPQPEWRWYRRQAEILTGINDTFRIFEQNYVRYTVSILQIKVRYTDEWFIYDWYFCNATNDHGTSGYGVYFAKAMPAKAPTVDLAEVTASGVTLSITPPTDAGGTWITGYMITYRANAEAWRPAIWYPPEDIIEIRYLNANQQYTFQVSALNPVGPGTAAVVQFNTLGKRVPYPCIITSPLNSPWPYAYNVQWNMQSTGGSVILLYLIKIRAVSIAYANSTVVGNVLGDWVDYPITALPLMSEFLIRNLQPSTYYQVQVLAQNSYGFSEPSLSMFYTAPPDQYGRPDLLVLAAPSIVPCRLALFALSITTYCYFSFA